MNENLNLCKILMYCPKGKPLWSPCWGNVTFEAIDALDGLGGLVYVQTLKGINIVLHEDGKLNADGECMLFPSKDQRDWSKFNISRKRFDPETFKPFDKVLIRLHFKYERWECNFFSNWLGNGEAICLGKTAYECIPYNDETKHLVGTQEDCPDYYKWWEK